MTEHVQPQAVLFDLDGTLVDSLPTIGAAMSAALKEFGHHIDVATIIPQIGAPMPVLAAELTGASEDEAEQINERYLSLYYDDFIQKTKPFDGATELLDRLSAAGVALGVVTNKNEHGAHMMVEIQGWKPTFDVVVGRDTTARPKPWPDGTLHGLQVLGASPEQAALVGDTEFDMGAGRDAELRYNLGMLGARDEARLREAGATHVFETLPAVGDLLLDGRLPATTRA
jgi:HAD superfamily hydrolase (TIGR01509 family)